VYSSTHDVTQIPLAVVAATLAAALSTLLAASV
jgi:hypothetical protein